MLLRQNLKDLEITKIAHISGVGCEVISSYMSKITKITLNILKWIKFYHHQSKIKIMNSFFNNKPKKMKLFHNP